MKRGRWEEEAANVGHLLWKFGSRGRREEEEVAKACGSRERLLVFQLFKFGEGWLFLQNEGVLGVFEEAANERKTLETDKIPDSQTPEKCRVAQDCAVISRVWLLDCAVMSCVRPHLLIPIGMPQALE